MPADFNFRTAPKASALALVVLTALAIGATVLSSCSKHHSMDFHALASADRIQVKDLTAPSDRDLGRIDDPVKIRYVLSFLERHKDEWTEPFGGPPIPQIMMDFYKEGERLGGFGLDSKRLIADPGTQGWWSLPISSEERDAFLKQLGLRLPRSGKT